MNKGITETSDALVTKIGKLINRDTAHINDFLLCENRIYRRLLKERYARLPFTGTDRKHLVKSGLKIRQHLDQILLRQKQATA